MTTYKDLKSVKYIDAAINFVEGLLGIHFKRTGKNRYSAHCPFHFDKKDSLMDKALIPFRSSATTGSAHTLYSQ